MSASKQPVPASVRGQRALREFKTNRRAFEEQTLNLVSREAAATGVQLLTRDEGWVEVENLRGAVRKPVTKCNSKVGVFYPPPFFFILYMWECT